MKKLLFFLLLMTAVVGRAQTSLDLLPVGTEASDFTITDSKTGKKIFQLSDKKTQKDKDGKTVPGVWTVLDFWASWCPDCRRDMPMVKAIYANGFVQEELEIGLFVGIASWRAWH